jgi:pimeloyl-ACP methyl ester carboxylesterase
VLVPEPANRTACQLLASACVTVNLRHPFEFLGLRPLPSLFRIGSLTLLLLVAVALHAQRTHVLRHDFYVPGEPGIRLFVREVIATGNRHRIPILLIHGARVPGIASFDLDVPGGSLAADLAKRGFAVYILDIRGYGASTRPREMDYAPSQHAPLVRSNQAAHDIGAVVDWINKRRKAHVALFGWATGGQWAGYYASYNPGKLGALVVLNSLYGGSSIHRSIGLGSDLEDPAHPGHFNFAACGGYRVSDERSLLAPWDRNIPVADKNAWRDPKVAQAYVDAALASDTSSKTRTPPSFRSPCGALEDSFYLASGRQLWDASLVNAPTLILASELDFWSRPEDRQTLAAELVHAPRVKTVVFPQATHFVHLDRAEHGRQQLLEEVTKFLTQRDQ